MKRLALLLVLIIVSVMPGVLKAQNNLTPTPTATIYSTPGTRTPTPTVTGSTVATATPTPTQTAVTTTPTATPTPTDSGRFSGVGGSDNTGTPEGEATPDGGDRGAITPEFDAADATNTPTAKPSRTPRPTRTPTATNATRTPPPDDQRDVVPPGSRRLGEFAVEWYCNDQGYGVVLVNNQQDWACTNKQTGAAVFVLQPSDFDKICQVTYKKPLAFAIRDGDKDVQAYNWSCYEWIKK